MRGLAAAAASSSLNTEAKPKHSASQVCFATSGDQRLQCTTDPPWAGNGHSKLIRNPELLVSRPPLSLSFTLLN